MEPTWRIGTSGWNYPHWKGVFYPDRHPKTRWLEYYARHFSTVELNATFYRLPKPLTFENWQRRTPQGFLWCVKASRYITHVKRLKDVREPVRRLFDSVLGLGPKLGPVLFQMPPSLVYDEERVREFVDLLPSSFRHVIAVRHPSWINDALFRRLEEYKIAFCISDTAGRYPYEEVVTTDFVYIRLHGSRKLYASEYTEEELQRWADKIRAWDLDVLDYFYNDLGRHAVLNARRLKELLGLRAGIPG